MKLSDFDYHLPEELIAQTPIEKRDHSRLLILDKNSGDIDDSYFYNLIDLLNKDDVLVVNKTKVINARLKGKIIPKSLPFKGREVPEGGWDDSEWVNCEIFLHKQLTQNSWDCMVYPGRRLKPGTTITFHNNSPFLKGSTGNEVEGEGFTATITGLTEYGKVVEFNKSGVEFLDIVDTIGQTPLPPYIKEKIEDSDRYQTVYSQIEGSVAAPTAGLHFTDELLKSIKNKGIIIEEVMLHIGLGTFRNVEQEDITKHPMHSEAIYLDRDVAERLNSYKKNGQKIIAVGTTSIRVLESMSDKNGVLHHGQKNTDIFIYPGYKWKFVESLITNFHLPKSTLIMLVSALAGEQNIKKAYEHAIDQKYRFFSFGDAMLID